MNKNNFIEKSLEILIKNEGYKFSLFSEEFFIKELINLESYSKSDLLKLKEKVNKTIERVFKSKEYKLKEEDLKNIVKVKKNYNREDRKSFLLEVPLCMIYTKLAEKYNFGNNKIEVYRIENGGLGIYQYLDDIGKSLSEKFIFEEINQTTPMDDGILKSLFSTAMQIHSREYVGNFIFGFNSIKQMYKWFPKDMIEYIKEVSPDSKIVKYEVEEKYLLSSNLQACFNKNKVIKKEEYSIYYYENLNLNLNSKRNSKKVKLK